MFENDILRIYSKKILGLREGDFWGFGCPNDAKMPCWLRLNPSSAEATFIQNTMILEKHLNPVMLVFIG